MNDVEQELRAFVQALTVYAANRIIGIESVRETKAGSEEREIASGFCLRVDDCIVFVTAGHALRKIHRWHNHDELVGVRLLKIVDQCGVFSFPLDIGENAVFYAEHDSFDVGMIILNRSVYEPLFKNGLEIIEDDEISWDDKSRMCHFTLMGFPSSEVKYREVVHARFPHGEKEFQITNNQMESLGSRLVLLSQPKIHVDKPFLCRFRPMRNEKSVHGMSGGPIVGFIPDVEHGVRIIAIQSKEQSTIRAGEPHFRWLTAVNAEVFVTLVRRRVREFLTMLDS